jgi:hypothetical protein
VSYNNYDLPTFDATTQSDINTFFVGRKLGEGQFREVFEYRNAVDRYVVKIEKQDSASFCNVTEWNIWSEVKEAYPQAAVWLAPIWGISPNGRVIVQRRTTPIQRMPKMIPSFLADLKPENFGRLGNRIVCHDYGNNNVFHLGLTKWKMVKRPTYPSCS